MLSHQPESITDIAAKAGPPVAVSGLSFIGVSLPDLVQIITLIYVALMIVDKTISIVRNYREAKKQDESHE